MPPSHNGIAPVLRTGPLWLPGSIPGGGVFSTMEKRKSVEEVIKKVSKDKMDSFNKFGYSYVAIRQLIDFMKVLEKNEEDYKDEINVKVCKDIEIHPSDILSHYIILESVNFYEMLKCLKRTNKSLPKLPSYYDRLQKVRNKIIGHRDIQEEFPLAEDVLKLMGELTKEASTEKIVEDVSKTFNSVNQILNKKS